MKKKMVIIATIAMLLDKLYKSLSLSTRANLYPLAKHYLFTNDGQCNHRKPRLLYLTTARSFNESVTWRVLRLIERLAWRLPKHQVCQV